MRLTIARSLLVFGGVVTAGLALSIGVQTRVLNRAAVNGPVYTEIVDGKDVVADILPPPLFLVETYMLANEATLNRALLRGNLEQIEALHAAYEERRAYWQTRDIPADVRSQLNDNVLRAGDQFWKNFDTKFKTAVEAGDTSAVTASLGLLTKDFQAHKAEVVKLVGMVTDHMQAREKAAADEIGTGRMWALGGSLASVLLFLAGLFYLQRRAIVPVTHMTAVMSAMANGDLSQEVPYSNRKDEVGAMATALQVFREAALENLRLQKSVEQARAQNDAQTAEREHLAVVSATNVKQVIEELGAGLERLSHCNIRMTLDRPFVEEFEPLRNDFNTSIGRFQESLEEVLRSTALLTQHSGDMRDASEQLAARTEVQAATLEQTAAALEEMTATVEQSSLRTNDTRALVKDAKSCAEASMEIVRETVTAMQRIESASSEITQIIGVIDVIAFQTNLLALNAGVEAARAGEAGKGFAVVAQEVRELAQRSAKAAKEIKGLIGNASREVTDGVRLVAETGRALDEIENFVEAINENVDAIATAAHEQADGIGQINSAVNGFDRMAQENAAMVAKTTMVSRTLSERARLLEEIVSRFQLNRRATIRTETDLRKVA